MISNKPFSATVLLAFVIASVVLGTGTSKINEQESYHVWTADPELTTAIACQDNDFGCEHPDDPNRHRHVPLPESVRAAICDLTRRTFEEAYYEGPTKYADLFGPVYRLDIRDSNSLHLYAYQLRDQPELSFRWYSIVLMLYDAKSNLVSLVPVQAKTDYQHYCPRPWIRFADVSGDEAMEVLLLTGHHCGTDADHVVLHILRIENGLNLREILALRTGISMPLAFRGDSREERYGFAARTIEKVGPNRFDVTVSLSKSKLSEGARILGFDVWEMGKDGRMHKTAQDLIVEDRYDYIFGQ